MLFKKDKKAANDAETRGARPEPAQNGIVIRRHFTQPGQDVLGSVAWETRNVKIEGSNFVMENVVIPTFYSDTAARVVASRYLRQRNDGQGRPSVWALIEQVVETFTIWGAQGGYFRDAESLEAFRDELTYMLLHQYCAFNSPVWFNFGVPGVKQQGSACFINPANDTMEGWIDLNKRESLIFKGGSGAGVNLSPIRSSWEFLSGGGEASGPIPLMAALDANAKAIKSGGRTRRAAKMVILDVEHPDLLQCRDGSPGFVSCKADAEKLAHHLIDLGFDPMFNKAGGAYDRIPFQAANHSVNAPDAFMEAVTADGDWSLTSRTTGEVVQTVKARAIWDAVNEAAWVCGDPGWQFRDHINKWNTCPNSFTITASNPCSEYVWDWDTSCNLASLRLTKFLLPSQDAEGRLTGYDFDFESFFQVIEVMILAMEIQVGRADYPTEEIAQKTKLYRTLGLGPADLGAFLMLCGVPYDSDTGRGLAAMLQSLMTAAAYKQSARISAHCGGPFAHFEANAGEMLHVLAMHKGAHKQASEHPAGINLKHPLAQILYNLGSEWWESTISYGSRHGFRNAQVTLAAPTGTISFLMDCATTGIEPDIALKKFKTLVGGGFMEYVNQSIRATLSVMGYDPLEIAALEGYVQEHGHLEGSQLLVEHLPIFDCAIQAQGQTRVIAPEGHVKMLGALQPFFSMAISKTVNCPSEFTPADMGNIYMLAWELGVKCVALYRDGCKKSQPLSTSPAAAQGIAATLAADIPAFVAEEPWVKEVYSLLLQHVGERGDSESAAEVVQRLIHERDTLESVVASVVPEQPLVHEVLVERPRRERLADERRSVTHKFDISGFQGYATVGLYPDGRPGELFIVASKQGSTISGLLDSFATAVSLGLQHGVSLETFVEKFKHVRFEPSGWTQNKDVKIAKSVVDYLFRWMELKFLQNATDGATVTVQPAEALGEDEATPSLPVAQVGPSEALGYWADTATVKAVVSVPEFTGTPCPNCGGITQPAGKCHICPTCGETTGCS